MKRIFFLMLIAVLLCGVLSCSEDTPAVKHEWSTDCGALTKRLKLEMELPFESCAWTLWAEEPGGPPKGFSRMVPAPEDAYICGIIRVSPETHRDLSERYSWDKYDGELPLIPPGDGSAEKEWLISPGFFREWQMKTPFCSGMVLLSAEGHEMYVYVQTI